MSSQLYLAAAVQAQDQDAPVRIQISNDSVTSHGYKLIHNKAAIDLSRAKRGLPLLVSHNQSDLPIGRVTNLSVSRNTLQGEIVFGSRGADVESDMRAGVITDVSVGAEFSPEHAEDDEGVIVVSKWRPIEVSAVAIGAIEGAEVLHSKDSKPKAGHDAPLTAEIVQMAEAERLEAIRAMFAPFDGAEYDRLQLKALHSEWTADQANAELLKLCAKQTKKEAEDIQAVHRIEAGVSDREKFLEGAEIAVRYMASGYSENEAGRAERKQDEAALKGSEFVGMSLIDLARVSLERQGVRCAGLNRDRIADLALKGTPQTYTITNAGHTSSDFTSLIGTTAYKNLAAGYEDAPESWRDFVAIKSMSNFQQHRFPNLSAFSDVAQRPEGGTYTHGTFSDKHENMTLLEYGRLFRLDRQTLINDDLNAFTAIPRRMGLAASRNVGDLVYAILTTGATTYTMNEDSTLLFDVSTHNNYITSGAAPSVTTLNAGFVDMGTQTDPSGNAVLGIRPSYILVPIALEATARVLMASVNDPAITPETPNPYQGALQVVVDHRLDTFNAAGWFMAARSGMVVDTVAVGFLNGQESPSLTQVDDDISSPGITYRVMHDAVAGALDWRGLWYNDGVT